MRPIISKKDMHGSPNNKKTTAASTAKDSAPTTPPHQSSPSSPPATHPITLPFLRRADSSSTSRPTGTPRAKPITNTTAASATADPISTLTYPTPTSLSRRSNSPDTLPKTMPQASSLNSIGRPPFSSSHAPRTSKKPTTCLKQVTTDPSTTSQVIRKPATAPNPMAAKSSVATGPCPMPRYSP